MSVTEYAVMSYNSQSMMPFRLYGTIGVYRCIALAVKPQNLTENIRAKLSLQEASPQSRMFSVTSDKNCLLNYFNILHLGCTQHDC